MTIQRAKYKITVIAPSLCSSLEATDTVESYNARELRGIDWQ